MSHTQSSGQGRRLDAQLGNFMWGWDTGIYKRILCIALAPVSNVVRLCLERWPKQKCEMKEGARAQSATLLSWAPGDAYRDAENTPEIKDYVAKTGT